MAGKRKSRSLRKKFPKRMQMKLVWSFLAAIILFLLLIIRITYVNASKGSKYIGNTSEAIYKWTGRQYEKINFNDIERGNSVFAAVGENNNTRILVVYE